MKLFKICLRKLAVYILTVMVLSVAVGNAFISANNITVTHAAGPAVLGYDVMYSICEYFGSMFLGYSCAREFPEVNLHNDDIARLGYQIIKTEWESGLFDVGTGMEGTIFHNSALLGSLDYYGQQYVFGSEAFQQIAENQFTVIQGGKNDGDDDDDDDDNDNIIHFPKNVGDTAKKWFALTTAGAAAVAGFISSEYQKWVNGEPDSILADFLADFNDTFSDYESIQNVNGSYHISGYSRYRDASNKIYTNIIDDTIAWKIFAVISSESLYIYRTSNNSYANVNLRHTTYREDGSILRVFDANIFWGNLGYGINIPVFSSIDAALAAFESDDFSSALNYVKTYRIADWLDDDWAGKLIDPLTGLNALSNWYNIARHQGLNALGDNPSADDLADYLRDYFAQLGTDILPEVDPSLAPIKYPSTVEDVVIDPSSNPAVYPATGTDPGTSPGTGKDPGTNTDPTPGVVDIPIEDIVPTVNDSFGTIAGTLRYKFPFSIPWDIHYILSGLSETPKAPRFELPIVIERYHIDEKIIIDMSMFQTLSDLSRSLFTVLFSVFLINLTFKVVGMRKEE